MGWRKSSFGIILALLVAGCSVEFEIAEKHPLVAYPGDKVKLKIGVEGVVDKAYQYPTPTGNHYVVVYKDVEGRVKETYVAEHQLESK